MSQRSIESKDRIRYGSANLDYFIKRSKRIKTSELIVDSDRIEIRTPLNKTIRDTRDIVRGKAEWILRKQEQLKNSIPGIIKPSFKEDSTLPYLGKNYPLRINKNQSRNTLSFVDGEFTVDITSPKTDEGAILQIKRTYEDWMSRMGYSMQKSKVKTYSQKLGVELQDILVKTNIKNRWASLTRKGSINFNIHLIKAPQDVIDYIVLHELCYLKINGHSHHYWDLVYGHMQIIKRRLIGLILMEYCLLTITELYDII
jgi:predicted metal-dependent hydrolase